eukprot:g28934.t1
MQNLLLLQSMAGVNVKQDIQEVKSQQALLFASSKIVFHSRVHSVEQDEMFSGFFFEKVHKENSVLSSLKEEDGSATSSQADILRISKSFYAELCNMKPTDSMASQSFLSPIKEVLDNSMRERLDQPLSQDELTKALKSLEKNKTPGSNSLLAELYSALWDLIVQDQLYNNMLLSGSTCESMRKRIITLIYKQKGKSAEIRNWQHISLLNADYKILSKVISNWVRSALESVLHPSQTCAVLGMTISENLVLLRNMIAYVQDKVVDACLISL